MKQTLAIGLVLGLVLIYFPIFTGDGVATFFDIPSILIVLGGTAAALLANYTLDEFKTLFSGMGKLFKFQEPELGKYVEEFTELSRVARREGLLALDRKMAEIDDELTRFGLEMAVDGTDAKEIDAFMEQRIENQTASYSMLARLLSSAGSYAPSFGMIGTLIGLIQMMQNLSDPAAIGAGMAVAMITTFYGALFANLFFLPMAARAGNQASALANVGNLIRVGVIGIVRGDSPSVVEKRLALYVGDAVQKGGDADADAKKAA
jgi:chemotaxis protein MotA